VGGGGLWGGVGGGVGVGGVWGGGGWGVGVGVLGGVGVVGVGGWWGGRTRSFSPSLIGGESPGCFWLSFPATINGSAPSDLRPYATGLHHSGK